MSSKFTSICGVAPRRADATFFRSNMTLNLKTGGFITAEGMHFFSLFCKTPADGENWRVVSRGTKLAAVICDDKTAEVLAKLLYWEKTHCEESYNWAPLTGKFVKNGMDPTAGVLGIEVNDKCRHLFETEAMESEALGKSPHSATQPDISIVEEEEREDQGVALNPSPLASITRIPNESSKTTMTDRKSEGAVCVSSKTIDDLTEQIEKIQTKD